MLTYFDFKAQITHTLINLSNEFNANVAIQVPS
jgi:hypothetical protein